VPDIQAGVESTFSLLNQRLGGINIIHGLGYLGSGMVCSSEMLVLGNEIVGMVERFMQGIEVNVDTLARELIHKVGPGGNYLQEEHTFKNFRKELWLPSIFPRQSYDAWQGQNSKDTVKKIKATIREILETHKVPPLPDKTVMALERIKQAGDRELAQG
jgi:trimethylamine--corrinoid protein Co-methyltransferase